jgi:hypothetical protein
MEFRFVERLVALNKRRNRSALRNRHVFSMHEVKQVFKNPDWATEKNPKWFDLRILVGRSHASTNPTRNHTHKFFVLVGVAPDTQGERQPASGLLCVLLE